MFYFIETILKFFHHYHHDGDLIGGIFVDGISGIWERRRMGARLGAWPHPKFGSMAAYMEPVRTWEHRRIGTWSSLRTSCRGFPDILLCWSYSKIFLSLSLR